MARRILLIEDEPGLRMTLGDRLASEGYEVESAADGDSGEAAAIARPFDLVILDIMLPRRNGFDLCRDLRKAGMDWPLLMLTARDQTADKVRGLKTGADDYVTKPFEMSELLARIEALLRRVPTAALEVYRFGDVKVDLRRTEVVRDGKPVTLSAKEFQLLRYFVEHQEETLSRERLLSDVWGYERAPSTRTVDVHVAWLRQKLEDDPKDPQRILTVYGFGYRFTSGASEAAGRSAVSAAR